MSNHLPLYEYGSIRKATEKYTAKGQHKQRDEFLISSGILKSRSSETVFGDSLKSSPDSWLDDKSEGSSVSRLVSKRTLHLYFVLSFISQNLLCDLASHLSVSTNCSTFFF